MAFWQGPTDLGCFGAASGCIGLHWAALGCIGLHWAALGWIGLHWAALGCIGLDWAGLGWIGLHWAGLQSQLRVKTRRSTDRECRTPVTEASGYNTRGPSLIPLGWNGRHWAALRWNGLHWAAARSVRGGTRCDAGCRGTYSVTCRPVGRLFPEEASVAASLPPRSRGGGRRFVWARPQSRVFPKRSAPASEAPPPPPAPCPPPLTSV